MKFGAQLTGHSVHEWRAHNIQYNELKQEIRRVTTGSPTAEELSSRLERLAQTFNEEFDNFTLVVKSKIGEIDFRIGKCEDLVSYLATHSPDPQGKSQFKREISRLTRDLQQLSRFSRAQYIGFRKLIKKYRKWSQGGNALDQFEERLEADDSAAMIDLTPRFLELSILWDMARDGRFEALSSIRGEQADVGAPPAAQDAQFATQPQSLRVWIPADSVMEVLLTLLPHMRLDGTEKAMSTFFDNEHFDYVRSGRQPGEAFQNHLGGDSWFCAPTGGLRRFTVSRFSASETKKLLRVSGGGGLPACDSEDDAAKKIVLGWLEASRAEPFATITSIRTRYNDIRPATSELNDPTKVWAVVDENIQASLLNGSSVTKFPHAVLQISWTGEMPAFISEVEESHLIRTVSSSFSLYAFAALSLYPSTFVGRPSWLRLLDEGTDIHRAAQVPATISERSASTVGKQRKLCAKRSTSILLNHSNGAPDLEDDEDLTNLPESSSPSTLRYWNEFDYPDEDADFAVFVDPDDEDTHAGVAEQLSQPIIQFSQKVKRSVNQLRNMITGESSRPGTPSPTSIGDASEADPLLPYSPRLTPQDSQQHYESFPSVDPRTATRDVIMAMLSCICYALATTVTFLAYSIIIGDDGAPGLAGSIKSVIIIGLIFGMAFSGLGTAIFNLQAHPSWLGQVTTQCAFFALVCSGAGGIAWVSVS